MTNATLSPREHYRTIQVGESPNRASLHVPTRRENFNSHTSIKLGRDNEQSVKKNESQLDKHPYNRVSRYESTPRDTLNVHDPAKSQSIKDPQPTVTVQKQMMETETS